MWTEAAYVVGEDRWQRSCHCQTSFYVWAVCREHSTMVHKVLLYQNNESSITVQMWRYSLTWVLGEVTRFGLACFRIGFRKRSVSVCGGICFRIWQYIKETLIPPRVNIFKFEAFLLKVSWKLLVSSSNRPHSGSVSFQPLSQSKSLTIMQISWCYKSNGQPGRYPNNSSGESCEIVSCIFPSSEPFTNLVYVNK